MRLRPLAAAPVVLVALLVGAALLVSDRAVQLDLVYPLEGTAVKHLAAAGFPAKSRLRLAWLLHAVSYAALAVKTPPGLDGIKRVLRLGDSPPT